MHQKTKKIIKSGFKACSVAGLFWLVYLFAQAFYSAYSSPTKSYCIFINKFGEANFEFYLVGIVLFFSLIGCLMIIKDEFDNVRRIRDNRCSDLK